MCARATDIRLKVRLADLLKSEWARQIYCGALLTALETTWPDSARKAAVGALEAHYSYFTVVAD